jgi:hypothetical protein
MLSLLLHFSECLSAIEGLSEQCGDRRAHWMESGQGSVDADVIEHINGGVRGFRLRCN